MNRPRAAWRVFISEGPAPSILPKGIASRLRAARARWQRRNGLRVSRLLGCGDPPVVGPLVSNHLGCLDAVLPGAMRPMVLVAKSNVYRWPVIGFPCRLTGTIFFERARRAAVRASLAGMDAALRAGMVMPLFPASREAATTRI